MAAILTNGVLTIRTAPIFQPLLAKRFCIILVMAFHLDQATLTVGLFCLVS